MSLLAGTRLGAYEILSPLGAGGMGEVYRARDTRLERMVALKVLPEEFFADKERIERFEREAKSLAAVTHPSIAALYSFEEISGRHVLVMELAEGQTLAERLAKGPLTGDPLLRTAIEIASALDAAHRNGIVHRDLKPSNVMLTKSGAKLLDFGLAKAAASPVQLPPLTSLPTEAPKNLTQQGTILGTFQYMAPEMLQGREADSRSDIFAFGATLYEMATGRKAFSATNHASLIAAILSSDPAPISSIRPLTPPALVRLVGTCLAKDPEDRWQSAHDVATQLKWIAEGGSQSGAPATLAAPRRSREVISWLLVALLAALLAAVLLRRAGPSEGKSRLVMRFAIPIPPATIYAPSEVSRGVSVSPDGTRLAIEAFSRGRRRLFVRPLDSEEATELEGSTGATAHFWSPDSRFIAFYAEGKMKKIAATGGPPVELCDAPFALVGTWNREGTILFSRYAPPGIYRVPDTGGEAIRILEPDASKQESNLIWPHFLPDGRRFLYFVNAAASPPGKRELRQAALDSKETHFVAYLDSRVEFVPGYLIHARESALFAQPFDERKAQVHGEPRQLASNAHYYFGPAHTAFSVSQTGVLAYQTAARPSRIVWFDRHGTEIAQLGEPSVVKGLRISPDGTRVAEDVEDKRTGTSDVWVFDLARTVSTRVHSDAVDEITPVWSLDGSKIIYRSNRSGPPHIYEITPGAPGSEHPLLQLPGVQQPEDLSRDGRFLVFLNQIQSTLWNVWLLPLQGDRKPFPWRQTRFNEFSPRFSPDGRWIAYESEESGVPEIYAALTEGGAEKRRISPSGGRRPRWRADGRELYYIASTGFVMAVPVKPGPRLDAGPPAPLFRTEPEIENYDVTPDGSRFLISTPLEKVRESPLRVIVNWPAMLKGPG